VDDTTHFGLYWAVSDTFHVRGFQFGWEPVFLVSSQRTFSAVVGPLHLPSTLRSKSIQPSFKPSSIRMRGQPHSLFREPLSQESREADSTLTCRFRSFDIETQSKHICSLLFVFNAINSDPTTFTSPEPDDTSTEALLLVPVLLILNPFTGILMQYVCT